MRLIPNHFIRSIAITALVLSLSGCSAVTYKPDNDSKKVIDNNLGYRLSNSRDGDYGDHLVLLAFSGGGTRAAALSYGVLKSLRDSKIYDQNKQVSVLNEVDSISSVSGGSFTAAYYGLFGDKIFDDYEHVFLKQSIQGALIAKLFDPSYWWQSLFSGFDRTEMAIEYYDHHIFEGKRFRDFRLKSGPFVEINATDLGDGVRFSFVQAYFDLICSDLDSLSVARAVTASSAVPVAFPTVVLKNHGGECDISKSDLYQYAQAHQNDDPRLKEMLERMDMFKDSRKKPFLHLTDGGIVDNLGLRALTDRLETIGSGYLLGKRNRVPKDILVISVDAEVMPEHTISETPEKPSISDTISAFSDARFRLFNYETRLLLDRKLQDVSDYLSKEGHNIPIYNVSVSFSSIQMSSLKSYFNSLPTSLELSSHDVDMLESGADMLLRQSKEYRAFLKANESPKAPPKLKIEDKDREIKDVSL